MTNTKLLERVIAESGYKKAHIASKMGINAYTLSLKIKNEKEFKASEIDAICSLLNIDVEARMNIFFCNISRF